MRYAVVLLLLVLLLGSLACQSAARLRATYERAAVLMVADGIDPAVAAEGQWDTYVQRAIDERGDSWVRSILAFWPELLLLYGAVTGGKALGTGRGRANLDVIFDKETEWSETGRSIGAIALGMRSPDIAHERAKKVAA